MLEMPPIDGFIEHGADDLLWKHFVGCEAFSPLRVALAAMSQRAEIRRILLPLGDESLPPWLGDWPKLEIVPRQTSQPIEAQAIIDGLVPFLPPTSVYGPALMSEYCAFANAAGVLDAFAASSNRKVQQVLVVSDSTALLTDEVIEMVIAQGIRRGFTEAAYFGDGPRGLFPVLWAPAGLVECAQLGITLQAVFWNVSGVFGQMIAHVPSAVKRLRRSLSLREPRSRALLKALVEDFASRGEDLEKQRLEAVCEAAEKLADSQRGRFPKDLEIEVFADRPFASSYLPSPSKAGTLMSVADFERITAEITPEDGVNLTLGGFGDPLLHPQIDAIIRAAKPKFAGIALKTFALTTERFFELGELGVKIVQWRFGAWGDEWAPANGVDDFIDFDDFAKPAVEIRERLGEGIFSRPLLIPEVTKSFAGDKSLLSFWAFCKEAKYQPLVSAMATYGGAIESTQAITPLPGTRKSCLRLEEQLLILADGSVLACTQMAGGDERIGNAKTTPIQELWQGQALTAMVAAHRAGEYQKAHAHCLGCKEWCRLT